MIRIVRPYDEECKRCDAFKPMMTAKKIREDGETVDQYVQIECGNSWVCGQVRKAIDRGKSGQDEEE